LTNAEMRQVQAYEAAYLATGRRGGSGNTVSLPSAGMESWFKLSGTQGNNSQWRSSVKTYTGNRRAGTVYYRCANSGNGAAGKVCYAQGNTAARYDFGAVIKTTFTICSISRYTGGTARRILLGSRSNWLHGHWNSRTGIAHYDGWLAGAGNRVSRNNWVYMCGSSHTNFLYVNSSRLSGNRRTGSGRQSLRINYSGCCGGETSNWAVAEVITWNRALTDAQMRTVQAYQQTYLRTGQRGSGCRELYGIIRQRSCQILNQMVVL
jgi:hypothetical protein